MYIIYIISRHSSFHRHLPQPHLLGFGQFDPGNAFSSPLAHDLLQDVVGMPRRHVFPGAQCQVGNLAGAWHAWRHSDAVVKVGAYVVWSSIQHHGKPNVDR